MKIVEVTIGHFWPNLGQIEVFLTFGPLLLEVLEIFFLQVTPLI